MHLWTVHCSPPKTSKFSIYSPKNIVNLNDTLEFSIDYTDKEKEHKRDVKEGEN